MSWSAAAALYNHRQAIMTCRVWAGDSVARMCWRAVVRVNSVPRVLDRQLARRQLDGRLELHHFGWSSRYEGSPRCESSRSPPGRAPKRHPRVPPSSAPPSEGVNGPPTPPILQLSAGSAPFLGGPRGPRSHRLLRRHRSAWTAHPLLLLPPGGMVARVTRGQGAAS